jgi:staphylococcal nuclease domain-containing protein 1
MATGWLKGTVKAVPSGDSLLIMGSVRGGPPPEKTITLAALIAPKLARRDGRDEPFAWDSREFLRKKCIGKDVTFKVDYTVPAINREFGMVMLGSENVAFDVVSQGWAKVRQQGSQNNEVSSAYLTELTEREEKAQTQGYGIWTKTPGAAEASIRELPPFSFRIMFV